MCDRVIRRRTHQLTRPIARLQLSVLCCSVGLGHAGVPELCVRCQAIGRGLLWLLQLLWAAGGKARVVLQLPGKRGQHQRGRQLRLAMMRRGARIAAACDGARLCKASRGMLMAV